MDFSLVSLWFFVFFGATLGLYYVIPRKYQWCYLLVISLAFFLLSSIWYTILYMLISADLAFLVTINIASDRNTKKARNWLLIGILGNLVMLAALKYVAFILTNLNFLSTTFNNMSMMIPIPSWAAPIGISFYTLSAIGYMVDCYWGLCEPSGNYFKDLLFVCYWPVLTSGPIIKYGDIEKTLFAGHEFDSTRVLYGLQRMLWGITKKIVISSRLGVIVDVIYGDLAICYGFYIWVAAGAFMLQLYTDFSGCMDIILGASECYGIVLPENFRMPFFSKSIQEFWQRWHITLGGWYREYILYPLLNTMWLARIEKAAKKKYGRRAGRLIASCTAMLFVWLLFGLWHGGDWKYVVMGLYFWILIIIESFSEGWFNALWNRLEVPINTIGWKVVKCLKVFVLVTIGNMFFRLHSLSETFSVIRLGLHYNPWIFVDGSFYNMGLSVNEINLTLGGLIVLFLVSLFKRKGDVRDMISSQPLIVRWAIYLLLLFVPMVFGIYGPGYDAKAFIYGGF